MNQNQILTFLEEYITSKEAANLPTGALKIIVHVNSPVDMKKTGNPFIGQNIRKKVILFGSIGKNYLEEVHKQNPTNPPPEAKPRTWGRLINPYVIEHKEKYYLQMFVDSSGESVYYLDNAIFPVEKIQEFLPVKPRQETGVIIRDIKFENIEKIIFEDINETPWKMAFE